MGVACSLPPFVSQQTPASRMGNLNIWHNFRRKKCHSCHQYVKVIHYSSTRSYISFDPAETEEALLFHHGGKYRDRHRPSRKSQLPVDRSWHLFSFIKVYPTDILDVSAADSPLFLPLAPRATVASTFSPLALPLLLSPRKALFHIHVATIASRVRPILPTTGLS